MLPPSTAPIERLRALKYPDLKDDLHWIQDMRRTYDTSAPWLWVTWDDTAALVIAKDMIGFEEPCQ
jgi:hypothetical protein